MVDIERVRRLRVHARRWSAFGLVRGRGRFMMPGVPGIGGMVWVGRHQGIVPKNDQEEPEGNLGDVRSDGVHATSFPGCMSMVTLSLIGAAGACMGGPRHVPPILAVLSHGKRGRRRG